MIRFAALLYSLLLLAAPGLAVAGQGPLLTLDEALAIAMHHSPLIREAEAIRDGAREEITATRADFLPKASAQYGYARLGDEPFQRIGGVPIVVADADVHRWDLSLSQPLFTGFAVTSRHEMAKIGAEIRELERQQQIVTVRQDLRIAWFEALLAAQPDYLLLPARPGEAEKLKQNLLSQKDLAGLEALRPENILVIDADSFSRPGPRVVAAVEQTYALLSSPDDRKENRHKTEKP